MSLDFAGGVTRGEFRLDAEVSVAPGEVVALLGPNGAGKTTMLRAIAGLLPVDRGRISVGDLVLDDAAKGVFIPPDRRRMGVVFQDHRLFPHLRVVDNVAFGLRASGIARASARTEARRWLDRLHLGEFHRRRPRDLSGGQSQRVALARALASRPVALLLDEPLAALDVQTRAEVQGELREHLGIFDGPTLIVTHDPIEALLLASRIVVLERGAIVQQGTAAEITTRPVTPYVARLVGMNLYAGTSLDGRVSLEGGTTITTTDGMDGPVLVAVRPSAFTLHTAKPQPSSARNVWNGTIAALAPLADRIRVTVECPPTVLVDVTAAAIAELAIAPGDHVWLTAKATDVTVYPAPVAT